MTQYARYIKKIRSKYLCHFYPGGKILEVGCGDCVFFRLLADLGFEMVGIDVDPNAVEQAQRHGLNVLNREAVRYLNQNPDKFDGIICSHIIEHIHTDRIRQFFWGCKTALKAGGTLLILTPNVEFLGGAAYFWDDPTHVRPYTVRSLERLLRSSKFSAVSAGFDKDTKIVARQPIQKQPLVWIRAMISLMIFGRAGMYSEIFGIGIKKSK